MEDWTLRNIQQQDWISLVFLFNFIVLTILKTRHKTQFQYFIRFIDSELYFKIYGKQKSVINSFTTLGAAFLIINCTLLIYYHLTTNNFGPNTFPFFSLILITTTGVVIIRHFFLQLCFKIIEIERISNDFKFKGLNFLIQISIPLFVLLLLYQYSVTNGTFLNIISGITFTLYLLSQLSLFKEYWHVLKHNLLYLILYLCAFKLAPWILLYSTFN